MARQSSNVETGLGNGQDEIFKKCKKKQSRLTIFSKIYFCKLCLFEIQIENGSNLNKEQELEKTFKACVLPVTRN